MISKLVRNNIPAIIERTGRQPVWYNASPHEMGGRLIEKIREEVSEFEESPCIEEAADIYEVFLHMINHWKLDIEIVKMVADSKRKIKGSFSEGIVLEGTKRP